jgi:hypothetical protein
MTNKDYALIAKVIKSQRNYALGYPHEINRVEGLTIAMCIELHKLDSKFNPKAFYKSCGFDNLAK